MNATTALDRTTADHDLPALTGNDRCDACGARAYVRVRLDNGQLLFCAHHARKHMDSLRAVAVSIQDDSGLLLAAESGARAE